MIPVRYEIHLYTLLLSRMVLTLNRDYFAKEHQSAILWIGDSVFDMMHNRKQGFLNLKNFDC